MSIVLCLGNLVLDVYRPVGAPPRFRAGGSGSNVAAGLASQGLEVVLAGILGTDPGARLWRHHWPTPGPALVTVEGPGRIAVCRYTDDQAREGRPGFHFGGLARPGLWPALARALDLRLDQTPPPPESNRGLVFLDSYLLQRFSPEEAPGALADLVSWVKARGFDLAVDLANPFVVRAYGPLIRQWLLPDSRLVFGTQAEWQALGEGVWPGLVAVEKFGPRGAGLGDYRVPAPKIHPESTVGAGDSLAAGFLAAWMAGCKPKDCLDKAAAWLGQVFGQS